MGKKMIDCLILGDSIAVGTQQFAKQCELVGKGGINTWQFNKNYAEKIKPANTVFISLGSNDHRGVHTFKQLMATRQKVEGNRVFWILPAGNLKAGGVDIKDIQDIVHIIAKNFGDTVLPVRGLQQDGIHPSWSGYKDIVERTK
jgi:lysophospholipase L1-like esterase